MGCMTFVLLYRYVLLAPVEPMSVMTSINVSFFALDVSILTKSCPIGRSHSLLLVIRVFCKCFILAVYKFEHDLK